MELTLIRKEFTEQSTIGELHIDGKFECYILEDKDRSLDSSKPLQEIVAAKIKGKTAIPYGRYQIVVTMSTRFKKLLPLLVDVPGYSGIRIHSGNTAADTEGCLLPGKVKTKDMVRESTVAFKMLFEKIQNALRKEKVYITISK